MIRRLSELGIDETARVLSVESGAEMARRLMDIGLVGGEPVQCVLNRGGMSAYLVRGAVMALRECDAGSVEVQ